MHRHLLITIAILTLSALQTISGQVNFVDEAANLGIDHTYLLNNSGGGVSFADFDGDGWDDISLATGPDELIHFYKNEEGTFNRIPSPVDNIENAKSVLWVDYDNDGDKDLYISAFEGVNRLYNNNGSFEFTDVTFVSGLSTDSHNTFGANWADYNRDGWLDLYYGERKSDAMSGPNENRLWRNNANGTFTEVTISSGAQDPERLPFCAAFFDMDNDKWPDIYIANDKKKINTLLKNNGDGSYSDVGEACGADIAMDAMSVTVGDYDNNGLSDLYVTNIPAGSILLTNTGDPDMNGLTEFKEEADLRGVKFEGSIGWGANFLDADNDGWLDLYVSGMIIGTEMQSSAFYHNDGTGHFTEPDFGFVGDTVRSYTNAIGDIDNDGQVDIIVNNSEFFKSQLWKSSGSTNNYLKIKLEGVMSNRDGIGAKIETYSAGHYQMRFTHCGIAYQGQNSLTEIIGLGNATIADSVIVTWPTGHIDRLYDIEGNQNIDILEGQTTGGIVDIDEDVMILSDVNQIELEVSSQIYPNPTTGLVFLKGQGFDGLPFKIYAPNGQLVKVGYCDQDRIDLSDFESGLYFISLIGKSSTHSYKIIKR